MEGISWLAAASIFVWLVFGLYLFSLARRLHRLERQVRSLPHKTAEGLSSAEDK